MRAFLPLLLLATPLAAQDDEPPLTTQKVVGQVVLGTAAAPVGFVVGGLTTRWVARRFGVEDDRASDIAYAGAYAGAALAAAAPPALVGSRGVTTGSYGAAVAGAVAGQLAGWGIVRLNQLSGAGDRPCHITCVLSTVAVFVLPSVGATVGFNLSRKYESGRAPTP